MICFIKIQSENMKMTSNISLIILCMIFNLSKRDGFTVMRKIYYVVLSLLPLLCNDVNFTKKLHQKK